MEHPVYQSPFTKSVKSPFGTPYCINDTPRKKDTYSAECLPPFPSKRLREALSFGFLKNEPPEMHDRNISSLKNLSNETKDNTTPPLKIEIKLSRSSEKKLFELGYYLSVKHLNIDWEEEKDRYLYKHIKHLRALEKYRKPLREYILGTTEKVRKEKPNQSVKLYIVKNENSFWYVGKQCVDSNYCENQNKNGSRSGSDKIKDKYSKKKSKSSHSPIYNTAKQMISKRYKDGIDCNPLIKESSLVTCADGNIRSLSEEPFKDLMPMEVDEVDNSQQQLSSQSILNKKIIPNGQTNHPNKELNLTAKRETEDYVSKVLTCGDTDLKMNHQSVQTDGDYNQLLLSRMEQLLRSRKRLQEQNKILSENLSCIMTDFNVNQIKSRPNRPKLNWCVPPEIQSSSSPINNLNKLFVRVP